MQVNPAVVVVPPFQCAWLTDPEYILHGGRGCLTFEVRGAYMEIEDAFVDRVPSVSNSGRHASNCGVKTI